MALTAEQIRDSCCVAAGQPVPAALTGELHESSADPGDSKSLQQDLAEHGYVLLRRALPQEDVMTARAAVLRRLANVGEVREPTDEAIATGDSKRREATADLGAFWRSIAETHELRCVTHGPKLAAIASAVLGRPALGMDYLFPRAVAPGRATGMHFDGPFFTRYTAQVVTAWVPLGSVPRCDGPILVVEGSHRFDDLIEPKRDLDLDRDRHRKGEVSHDPIAFAKARRCRLLTADFEAGDVLLFGMFLLHGSFDNHSPQERVRLSCDVRYQSADDPRDPRYFGSDPRGTFGGGYGELNGARPMTEEWHRR